MRIVIIGVGEVGFHVAKALSKENFDITVIDIDPEKCRRASENLDVIVVEGNGASPKNLIKARVEGADYVLALTRIDEVNLIASQQAHILGAIKIIARLRNQQYSDRHSIIRPEKFGIDLVIHPEKVVSEEIARLVRHPYATHFTEFEGGRLQMMGLRVNEGSMLTDKSVKEFCDICNGFEVGIVSVTRKKETTVPWGDFIFQRNDIVFFIFENSSLLSLLSLLDIPASGSSRVMILGGSKIGRSIAEILQQEMSVRLVESNREKAEQIANNLEHAMVINSDGTDVEFLKSENIQDVDNYVAVTESEKTNLLSGMLAYHLGAKQSIIHMVRTEYMPIIQEIGIGTVLSKNMSTVNSIIKEIRNDQSETALSTFDELDVDVWELSPEPGSIITQMSLNEIDFPKDSIIGAINHHGHLSIAKGDSQITHEDVVLVFGKMNAMDRIHKLFVV